MGRFQNSVNQNKGNLCFLFVEKYYFDQYLIQIVIQVQVGSSFKRTQQYFPDNKSLFQPKNSDLFIYLFVHESKRTFNTDGVKEVTRSMLCEGIHALHGYMTGHK